MTRLAELYQQLLDDYGPQGWWPLINHPGTNPTKTGSITGYHPGDYSFPHNRQECFEICVGAILTQNTAWLNVEKALRRIWQADAMSADALLALPREKLTEMIRPSGYFNVKARKLQVFAEFFRALPERMHPTRKELLAVWGIGPETADNILLYAYNQPELVVDAYTRRVLAHLKMVPPEISYACLKHYCMENLPADVTVYQEFHALMVDHAKRQYSR
jgi:endonuclease-3 related protein